MSDTRQWAWRCCVLLVLVIGSTAVAETVNGFITNLDAAGEFSVGTNRVALNEKTECELGSIYGLKVVPGVSVGIPSAIYMLRPHGLLRVGPIRTVSMPCGRVKFAVGLRIHLSGVRVGSGVLVANRLTIYSIKQPKFLSGTSLIEEGRPKKSRSNGSEVQTWIDGYKMGITPATRIQVASESHHPVSDPIRVNTWVTYTAHRVSDQSVIADSLYVFPNKGHVAEGTLLKVISPEDRSSNCIGLVENQDQSVQFAHGKPINVVPDRSVQEFVSSVGVGLIPEYQRSLSDDATKIRFRFCVVRSAQLASHGEFRRIDGTLPHQDPELGYDDTRPSRDERMNDIVALPTGLILVPDSALANLHNKAQLGALLSYAITTVLQKEVNDAWRVTKSNSIQNKKNLFRDLMDLNCQVLRLGIRQLYLSGYDIREAPWAWTVAQGEPANDALFGGSSSIVKPWYAAYAFDYISTYYSNVNYSKLVRGDAEYADFLKELHKADPEAFLEKKK